MLELKKEENSREYFDNTFRRMALAFGAQEDQVESALKLVLPITQHQCYKDIIIMFEMKCRGFSDYGLKYAKFLLTICESGIKQAEINETIDKICK